MFHSSPAASALNPLPPAPPLVQLAQAAPPTGSFAPFTASDAGPPRPAAVVAEPVAGTPTPAGGAVLAAPSAAVGMQAPAAAGAASGHRFPAYTSVDVDGPYIAITFDDGPNPETTPKLLKMLEARGVKATFFVVGTRASENPDLLRRMVAEGT